MTSSYDFIIIGAGLSGLSLAVRLVESRKFTDRKILLLDRTFKNQNDKTWCFWEKGVGYFENLIHHDWDQLEIVKGNTRDEVLDLKMDGYRYKMIRSIDFYKHCISVCKAAPNVTILYEEVTGIDTEKGVLTCGENTFTGTYIFSSVLLQQPVLQQKEFYLLQHFMGWMIEADTDVFNPRIAQLMNFNVSQQHGCTFVYVLPVTTRKALIEYTLFSEEELSDLKYEQGLKDFITSELGSFQYRVAEKEKGIIPMTNLHFPRQEGRLFYTGTAGGQTKASTGYTFQFIQKQSAAIVAKLLNGEPPLVPAPSQRFRFYDSVLLRVLHEQKIPGANVFYRMFQRNKASLIFRFLDNGTTLWEELQIMHSSNKSVFIPAAMKELI